MRFLFLLLTLACTFRVCQAEDSAELAKNNPVAIVALAQGPCEFKRGDGDWQAAYWLTLLRPEDQLRAGDKAKMLVNFFSDDHVEAIESSTDAKVSFKSMVRTSSGGNVRREAARDRAVTEIPIPYMLMRRLYKKDFDQADAEGAYDKEKTFLAASVRPEAFPPVFEWKNTGSPTYKLQLFNEQDEVLYESKVKGNRFKFPYNGPFNIAKNSQYFWQVTTPSDQIVVRKYPFVELTLPHSQEVIRAERDFAALGKKANQSQYTDMFLLYNNRKMIDRTLKILSKMANLDPENPMIYRGLVRAYLNKGCPAHAREALDKETRLNGVDPVID